MKNILADKYEEHEAKYAFDKKIEGHLEEAQRHFLSVL